MKIKLMLSLIAAFALTAAAKPALPQIEVSRLVKGDAKTYVEVDGKPFPYIGAEIRLDALLNCDRMKVEDVEKYISKASELGLNCVLIPIYWNLIEPEQDKYDFSVVDKILEYVNKYDLRMELLWFSTNMCGDTHSYLTPQYILEDPSLRFNRPDEGAFWGYYGNRYTLRFDDPWVLERETQAVTRLFTHIREWDAANGERHPVISAQVHNEPDGTMRWRVDQKQLSQRDGTPLTKPEVWTMTTNALDAVGNAIKNSPYKVLTRVNLVFGYGVKPFPEAPNASPADVFNLPGIDFVSVDTYKDNIRSLKEEVLAYSSIPGNFALVGENKGSYPNTAGLMLAAFAAGGGYQIYDLATSKFFIDNSGGFAGIDHGVYTWDLREKEFTPEVKSMIYGLRGASHEIISTHPDDFAALNIAANFPESGEPQFINTTGASLHFSTDNGAMGFALDCGDHLVVYITKDARLDISNGTVGDAEIGRYDVDGNFISEGTVALAGGTLNAKGGIFYRIPFKSAGRHTSNTLDHIGNKV